MVMVLPLPARGSLEESGLAAEPFLSPNAASPASVQKEGAFG